MTGTGLGLSSHNLHFGLEPIGSVTAPQAITVTNGSATTVTLSTIGAAGDYRVAGGSCAAGNALAPTAACTIAVEFAPQATGWRTGRLSIATTAAMAPSTISLQGIGGSATAPTASLSTQALTFAATPVGRVSGAQAIVLAVPAGSASLTLGGVAVIGAARKDFTVSTNCGSTLQQGSACVINVSFAPTLGGNRRALLWVASNATGVVAAVLDGTATAAPSMGTTPSGTAANSGGIVASTPELSFDPVGGGSTGGSLDAVLTNTSTSASAVGAIQASGGDFRITADHCSNLTLASGASCTVTVDFAPQSSGAQSGQLTAAAAGGAIPVVRLEAAGVAPQPTAALSTATVSGTPSGGGGGGAIGPWALLLSAAALLRRGRGRRPGA